VRDVLTTNISWMSYYGRKFLLLDRHMFDGDQSVVVCDVVKVVLANSRSQGNVRDEREEEKMLRLFIMVPTSFTQKDVEEQFTVCHSRPVIHAQYTLGHFTFWLRPWLSLLAETKH